MLVSVSHCAGDAADVGAVADVADVDGGEYCCCWCCC